MAALSQPVLDLARNRAPIYMQLSTVFRRFIVNGQWPVDRQIPTHETLAAQFEVNPATIRKAFEILEEEGLVERFRRRGTFVIAQPDLAEPFRIATDWRSAVRSLDGLEAEHITARDVKVAAPYHGHGKQAPGYRYLRRLYRRGRDPILIEESYLDKRLRRSLGGDAALRRTPILALLDAKRLVRHSDATIRFGIADGETAALLRVALNAPVVIVHQSVFGAGSALICETTLYCRGDVARIEEPMKFGAGR
jgi:GntR family transcriptional regulator